LDPASVNAAGLNLRGIQLNYKTPYVESYNFTLQYQISKMDSVDVGYVGSASRHLEAFVGSNQQSVLLPLGYNPQKYVAFPDFARGSSYADTIGTADYNALQTKYQRKVASGLSMLFAYTFSKTLSDAGDLLSNGSVGGFRAYDLPNWGIQKDVGRAAFDIRHAVSLSGSYDLPFGKGLHYMSGSGRTAQFLLGNWSTNFILTLDTGQPQTIGCATATGAGTGCYALLTSVSPYSGPHNVQQFYNPAAFSTPPVVTAVGQASYAPLGGGNTQVSGPPLRKLDFSAFKEFPVNERMRFEVRAEFFNLSNTPAFAQPGNLNYLNTATFGQITSTRDAPNDPREIQFALKFYF
jgi:hypothetical protein